MKTNTSAKSSQNSKKSNNSETISELKGLFENELKNIYWVEKELVKSIPKMIKNASEQELIDSLKEHLSVTEKQVSRLEEVFELIDVKAEARKSEAMAGLIKEAEDTMLRAEKGNVRDAGIIAAIQKIEHYEIASYGTLCAFAKELGEDQAADLLGETLNEEKEADSSLTEIAESSVNEEAVAEA